MYNIALVTPDYPPKRGGVARYLSQLVKASQGNIDVFVDELVTTRLVWPAWLPVVFFIRNLRKRGYDWVMVSHVLPMGTAAWIAALLGGARYIVMLHGLDIRLAQRSIWKRFLFRSILRRAGCVIANSEFTANEIQKIDPKLRPVVLTPGVEPFVLPKDSHVREQHNIPKEDAVILSVSRLVSRKGIDRLIEAMRSLPKTVWLVVVGDGEDRERLQKLAEPVRDRVLFMTDASDEERNAWYAESTLFALPVRDEGDDVEGFGIVYLEAALAALPVVAGKSGGASEAVLDELTGLLVDPLDTQALVVALKRLIDDPELAMLLGACGSQRARSYFRWEDRWERLKWILRDL